MLTRGSRTRLPHFPMRLRMVPASFPEANFVFDKPACMTFEQCAALSALVCQNEDGFPCAISCWKLTADDLEKIKQTGRVWLMVIGNNQPPVALYADKPFRST